ncbi:MAG: tRNA 2-selenouridine(34) synthase MnmH [Fusobacteria bacterium]|nr:tRNA 2-selenouridine(34) synthase MnmH [Fusobacteriota bacterium]
MSENPHKLISNFFKIITENTPLIDVRAPIEFDEGSFENTVNLPLMNTEERHNVGICYKEKGKEAALALGYSLVSSSVKSERVSKWVEFIENNPTTVIFCFRGGLRSKIAQEWIYEATGKWIPRIEGGYKTFRQFMLESLDSNVQTIPLYILGGNTGSGKTILLNKLENSIDLEGLAHHRGSSFGNFLEPQPTQINFENMLAAEIIKKKAAGARYLIMEDEGKHIGRTYMPKAFLEYFSNGKLVILEAPLKERIEITYQEYVLLSQKHYAKELGESEGLKAWEEYILTSFKKIKNRLGGERYQEIVALFNTTSNVQSFGSNIENHKLWIEILLSEYYDKMYAHQIINTTKKIIFKGNENEVFNFFNSL